MDTFPAGDADHERKNNDHVTRHRRQGGALDIAEREDDHDQSKEVIVQWQTPPAERKHDQRKNGEGEIENIRWSWNKQCPEI